MVGRVKSWASNFTKRVTNFIYNRLRDNVRRNLTYEYLWENSARSSAQFVEENFDDAVLYLNRMDFWDYVLRKIEPKGELIEVGVFKGVSVNYIARTLSERGDTRLVHGFDSFEGLEEDWSGEGLSAGFFQQGGVLPPVRSNVRLHKGWVQDTLGPYYAGETDPTVALLHIDTDTYTPAQCILEVSRPYLREGSIIVFDELIGYPNWRAHEFKALQETLAREDYRFIGFTSRQAAIRIVRTPRAP